LQRQEHPAGLDVRLQTVERVLARLYEEKSAHAGLIRDLEDLRDRYRAKLDEALKSRP
jgi:ribosomal 50S subunit-associated protein YjgA (DUF615 family)